MLYIGNQQYKIPDRTFITPEHYDSKIEYLQSTGTQWIDTGIKGNTGLKLEVTIQAEKYSEGVIGARISSVRYEHSLVYIAEGGIRLHVSTTNNNLFIYNPSSYSEWLNIVCDKNNMYINGTKVGNAPGYTPFTNNYSYYVFAVNSSNKAQPIGSSKLKNIACKKYLYYGDTLEEISHNIFKLLRLADTYKPDIILIEGVNKNGLGLAIMNRLVRACSYNYIER